MADAPHRAPEAGAYIAIDLKSFYASVECVERGLDPLTAHLVVADESRTEKTICLAVSPALKRFGIPGRARLFEVNQKIREANARRQLRAPGRVLTGTALDAKELEQNPALAVGFVTAMPRMALYMAYSARIYGVYTRFIAPEDIHPYSIDEVFIDASRYLKTYKTTPRELAVRLIHAVYDETGITATAGIGTNLYLCKIAMDIVAKRMPADERGVRIAQLDELSYRQTLWDHRPLTDFWRVGHGYARKLESHGMYTMGDVARRSLTDEDLLYRLFGVNAELLIDHAWGFESCTMAAIKNYRPENRSLSAGQVLQTPYAFDQAGLVIREMAEQLALELLDKGLTADQMELTVGYDTENLQDPARRAAYHGPVETDRYGRQVPKAAHGTVNLSRPTSSARLITRAVAELYDRIMDRNLLVRRMTVGANHVLNEKDIAADAPEQMNLFTDYEAEARQKEAENAALDKERRGQLAMLEIKKRFGKNAILRGADLQEGATARDRNDRIGGHKA